MTSQLDAHLETVDWDRLRALPALCLHRTLLLGLADPVVMPSPMSEAEGAWVREHAWTPAMRKLDDGFYRWCLCQHGTCWNCLNRRCDLCVHRQHGGPNVDDAAPSAWIHASGGEAVARIVLRDGEQPCRWVCACPCEKTTPTPTPSAPRRTRRRSTRPRPETSRPQRDHTPPTAGQAALFPLGTTR